jgi:hypothetical protein
MHGGHSFEQDRIVQRLEGHYITAYLVGIEQIYIINYIQTTYINRFNNTISDVKKNILLAAIDNIRVKYPQTDGQLFL